MAFKWISTSSRFRNSSGYVFLIFDRSFCCSAFETGSDMRESFKVKLLKSSEKRKWFFVHIDYFERESEKNRCEKIFTKRAEIFDHMRLFESSIYSFISNFFSQMCFAQCGSFFDHVKRFFYTFGAIVSYFFYHFTLF